MNARFTAAHNYGLIHQCFTSCMRVGATYIYIYNYLATFWENPVKGNEAN